MSFNCTYVTRVGKKQTSQDPGSFPAEEHNTSGYGAKKRPTSRLKTKTRKQMKMLSDVAL